MIFDIVDIFETDEEHREGLQYKAISENDCAIFLYDVPRLPSFWNINVPSDLWVSSVVDCHIVDSFMMDAGTTQPHKVSTPTCFVIESRQEIPIGLEVFIDQDGRLVVC